MGPSFGREPNDAWSTDFDDGISFDSGIDDSMKMKSNNKSNRKLLKGITQNQFCLIWLHYVIGKFQIIKLTLITIVAFALYLNFSVKNLFVAV